MMNFDNEMCNRFCTFDLSMKTYKKFCAQKPIYFFVKIRKFDLKVYEDYGWSVSRQLKYQSINKNK